METNSPAYNREMKRNSTIVLVVVVLVNVGYFGWRWATHETLESCLTKAAQAANGAHRAYADLRDICSERELARLIEKTQGKPMARQQEQTDKQVGLFDDLPKATKP